MKLTIINQFTTVARQIREEFEKDNRVRMCAAWLLDAINAAESVHDSELQKKVRQLREAMDA